MFTKHIQKQMDQLFDTMSTVEQELKNLQAQGIEKQSNSEMDELEKTFRAYFVRELLWIEFEKVYAVMSSLIDSRKT